MNRQKRPHQIRLTPASEDVEGTSRDEGMKPRARRLKRGQQRAFSQIEKRSHRFFTPPQFHDAKGFWPKRFPVHFSVSTVTALRMRPSIRICTYLRTYSDQRGIHHPACFSRLLESRPRCKRAFSTPHIPDRSKRLRITVGLYEDQLWRFTRKVLIFHR